MWALKWTLNVFFRDMLKALNSKILSIMCDTLAWYVCFSSFNTHNRQSRFDLCNCQSETDSNTNQSDSICCVQLLFLDTFIESSTVIRVELNWNSVCGFSFVCWSVAGPNVQKRMEPGNSIFNKKKSCIRKCVQFYGMSCEYLSQFGEAEDCLSFSVWLSAQKVVLTNLSYSTPTVWKWVYVQKCDLFGWFFFDLPLDTVSEKLNVLAKKRKKKKKRASRP